MAVRGEVREYCGIGDVEERITFLMVDGVGEDMRDKGRRGFTLMPYLKCVTAQGHLL